ncbi:hypothetical protein KY345_06530 [Candidatus Woesearchaeota archaeon]|nr:hypothetical protein [Candidatus Woesearchaeota archaeon]
MDLNTMLGIGFAMLLVIIISIVISSLPLYLSVMMLGGRASMLKVFFTNIIMAFFTIYSAKAWGFGALAIIMVTIIVYMLMFKLGIIRAFFAWLLQYFVAALIIYLALVIFGVVLPSPPTPF